MLTQVMVRILYEMLNETFLVSLPRFDAHANKVQCPESLVANAGTCHRGEDLNWL